MSVSFGPRSSFGPYQCWNLTFFLFLQCFCFLGIRDGPVTTDIEFSGMCAFRLGMQSRFPTHFCQIRNLCRLATFPAFHAFIQLCGLCNRVAQIAKSASHPRFAICKAVSSEQRVNRSKIRAKLFVLFGRLFSHNSGCANSFLSEVVFSRGSIVTDRWFNTKGPRTSIGNMQVTPRSDP